MDKNAIGTIAILAFLIVGSCIVMMLPEEEDEEEDDGEENGSEDESTESFLGCRSVAGSNAGMTAIQDVGTAAIQTSLSFY